ncbi:MAG TPA: hypothetical protein VD948_10985, partial [Rhodothermales bacterium]|nr:hypothetical protein [Rhodothermales bacterium]
MPYTPPATLRPVPMNLLLARHLWGYPGAWEDLFSRIKARGYGAIEAVIPAPEDRRRFRDLLDAHGLAYIAQVFTEGTTVDEHVASFCTQLGDAATLDPLLVNSHSGRDAWSDDEAATFFAEALRIEADHAAPVAHETHRMRVFYAPWSTARMLDHFDGLRVCCDFSHWVTVCERLLDDQQ